MNGMETACSAKTLSTEETLASGNTVKQRVNHKTSYPYGQDKIAGNRINHDRKNLRKPDFSKDNRRPHSIEETKRRTLESIDNPYKYTGFQEAHFHEDKRKRRSERIEGCVSLVLYSLIHTLNLQNMACGYYISGTDPNSSFHYYDFDHYRKRLEISRHRLWRSIAVLKKLGYVITKPRKEINKHGEYRTVRTEIHMTDKLFRDLGIYDLYLKDRDKALHKCYAREMYLMSQRSQRENFILSVTKVFKTKPPLPKRPDAQKSINSVANKARTLYQDKDHGKRVMERVKEIMHCEGLSPQEAIAKAKKEFYPNTDPP